MVKEVKEVISTGGDRTKFVICHLLKGLKGLYSHMKCSTETHKNEVSYLQRAYREAKAVNEQLSQKLK